MSHVTFNVICLANLQGMFTHINWVCSAYTFNLRVYVGCIHYVYIKCIYNGRTYYIQCVYGTGTLAIILVCWPFLQTMYYVGGFKPPFSKHSICWAYTFSINVQCMGYIQNIHWACIVLPCHKALLCQGYATTFVYNLHSESVSILCTAILLSAYTLNVY